MESDTIEIVVDDLPVPVDKEEYEANPEWVIAEVRKNRDEIRSQQSDFTPAPTYDDFMSEWGEPK